MTHTQVQGSGLQKDLFGPSHFFQKGREPVLKKTGPYSTRVRKDGWRCPRI
jgi:hypothetical protein